jgi:mRNA interferase RelE/StbE
LTFTVLLHPKAARELDRLENQTKRRVRENLKELRNNPDKIGKRLRPSDFWSLRIGDYRAIYEIDSAERRVIILFVGHRSKVYDDFSKIL